MDSEAAEDNRGGGAWTARPPRTSVGEEQDSEAAEDKCGVRSFLSKQQTLVPHPLFSEFIFPDFPGSCFQRRN